MKTRRLFFALWPDEVTRQRISSTQQILGMQGRAVARKNLHMTLVFMGEQPDDMLDAIALAADGVNIALFRLELDDIQVWTKTGITGLCPLNPPVELSSLQSDLQHALASIGLAREKRQYRPHVTLARNTQASLAGFSRIEPVSWSVDGFSLVESRLTSEGPIYDVLADWTSDFNH